MTSHETALEAAAKSLGHEGVYIKTATFERAISAYISTLSPDVSGLVERLREPSTNEPTMHLWSSIRKMLQDGNKGSTPRDVFESILGAIDEERSEAADALTSLSLQLADKDSALRLANERWEAAIEILRESKGRAETAEASLSAAKAENDRLRKALADMLPPKLDWREADADGYYVHHKASAIRDARAALSTPSKEAEK